MDKVISFNPALRGWVMYSAVHSVCVILPQVIFPPACTHYLRYFSTDLNAGHHQRGEMPFLLCPLSSFIGVSMSRCRSLLLILSRSYGRRDENGCLIMQRGQPIKGPGAEWFRGLFRAQLEGERKGGWPEKGVGSWGLIAVWCAGHLLSTYHWSGSTNNCPCLIDVQADWWMHGVTRGWTGGQMCT